MKISGLKLRDVESLAVLFNHYRQFYDCPPDYDLAEKFLRLRFKEKRIVVYGAWDEGLLVGFVLAYPSYCSIDAEPIYILHDIFVSENARRRGIASALLKRMIKHSMDDGAVRIDHVINKKNTAAHKLYEKTGLTKEQEFYLYAVYKSDL